MSPTDTELSYLPARFHSFYRVDQIFHVVSLISSSDCIYQWTVQNIQNPAACSDGEIENYRNYDFNPWTINLYNATYGQSVQEVCNKCALMSWWLSYSIECWWKYEVLTQTSEYYYASCGAVYPYNCTTTTTTTSTQSPVVYNYTLKVALVLNDPFVVRNVSAPGGYSGFSVAVMQLMASAMGAKLSFYEVPFGAELLRSVAIKWLCPTCEAAMHILYVIAQ